MFSFFGRKRICVISCFLIDSKKVSTFCAGNFFKRFSSILDSEIIGVNNILDGIFLSLSKSMSQVLERTRLFVFLDSISGRLNVGIFFIPSP